MNNLIDVSPLLNESSPNFQLIREIIGIERRARSRREHRLNDGPRYYMIVRRKPQRVYVFRILYAVNLSFQFLT